MIVTVRRRFCLPALLFMLVTAGCAIFRPGPEISAPSEAQLAAQPTTNQQLVGPMVTGTHGEVYLIWLVVSQDGKDWEHRFSRSEDGGVTWSHPLWSRKPAQDMYTGSVKMATGPTGQVYLAWQERNASKSVVRILLSRSLDGGKRWDETPRQLAVGDHLGDPHLLAGPDGALYVAWLSGDESERVLEVAASEDSGGTFAPESSRIQPVLEKSKGGIGNPRLAADAKGRLYAVWEEAGQRRDDAGIYCSRSEDRGRTWSEPILVSQSDADFRGAYRPQIVATSDGQVHLIWEQLERRTVKLKGQRAQWPIDQMIYFNRSLDAGRTWLSRPVRLSRPDPTSLQRRRSIAAQIASDGRGHVYVAFIEGEGKNFQQLVALHSADSGATWAAPVELGRTSEVKGRLRNAVLAYDDDGRLWLAWQEHAFGPKYGWFILLNRSEDHGQHWAGQAVMMSGPTVGQTTDGDLSVGVGKGGLVLVAWDHGWRINQSITLARSTDGGKNWSLSRLPFD